MSPSIEEQLPLASSLQRTMPHRSSYDLFSRLPEELFLVILDERLSQEQAINRFRVLASLSCLSKRWYRICKAPSLWTSVFITPNDVRSVEVCLERSKCLPLNVVIDFGFFPPTSNLSHLLWAFYLVLGQVSRWRSLRISAPREILRSFLLPLEMAYAPNLEELQLAQCEVDFSPADLDPIFDIFVGGLPSLKSLRTFGFIPVSHETFSQSPIHHIEVVRALDHPLEWDQFYDFLTAPSNLTFLIISSGRDGLLPDVSYPTIDLPHLQFLCIKFSSCDAQSDLLHVLHAPNVETMEVSWISDWEIFTHSLETSCDCHNAKFPNVSSLTLRMVGYTPPFQDYRLFGTFPAVNRLVLEDVQDVEPFLEGLNSPWVSKFSPEAYYAWPRLQTIVLAGSSSIMAGLPRGSTSLRSRIIEGNIWPFVVECGE